jgi:hypothetical protein
LEITSIKKNMKITSLSIWLLLLWFLISSCGENQDPNDLNAPLITSLSSGQSIQPSPGMVISPEEESVEVKFKVNDPSGVNQILLDIHGGFDGHSHARLSNSFERLNVKQIFSSTSSNPKLVIPKGAQEVIIDAHRVSWVGSNAAVMGNLLAGPYHITISATDQEGNQTSFADGSNYHTTFYIQRPYAPSVQVATQSNGKIKATVNQRLSLEGNATITENLLSSPLKFVWMRLTNSGDLDEEKSLVEATFGEVMAGESSWRKLKGESLANTETLDLGKMLLEKPINVPSGQANLSLVIWVEDTAGNVTREAIGIELN